jgi:hypothetical protein
LPPDAPRVPRSTEPNSPDKCLNRV